MPIKKKKKKTTQQPVTFATYKKANKTLQDWVAHLTLFHTSSISLLPVWSGLASPGPVPLGTWHHSQDDTEALGSTPHPIAPRGTDLPYPAVFLPKACGHSLLGCSAGQEGAPSASRGCLQPLPFPVAGPERLHRWCCLCCARREKEEAGDRCRKAG